MSTYMPDMARVREIATEALRRQLRNIDLSDLGWLAEEADWPEVYGANQLPQRHQHLFFAAIEQAMRTAVASFSWPAQSQSEDVAPARIVHGMFGGHQEHWHGRQVYVAACGTVSPAEQTGIWEAITCDGCKEALS